MRTSIVIPCWNTRELLRACLDSVQRSRTQPLEVIVVDDASADGSADMVASEFAEVELLRQDRNLGFAPSTNRGIARARGEWVLLLNADTELDPDALGILEAWLEVEPRYVAAAPRLVHPDGSTQRACMAFPNLKTALFFGTPCERWWPESAELRRYFMRDFDHAADRDVEQPPAACLLVRRAVLQELGGLDVGMPLFFSDVDLSKRMAERGLRTRFLTAARVVHHGGASTSQHPGRLAAWHADRLCYYRKHHGRMAGVWVKSCVLFAYAGFLASQLTQRSRRTPSEAVGPVSRSLARFLLL
jgi:hypothetical protein